MKEVEAQLAALQKENFDLKCRVYLMEHQGAVEQPGSQRLELEVSVYRAPACAPPEHCVGGVRNTC